MPSPAPGLQGPHRPSHRPPLLPARGRVPGTHGYPLAGPATPFRSLEQGLSPLPLLVPGRGLDAPAGGPVAEACTNLRWVPRDSSHVRAHVSAAGAPGGPEGQTLGRSRGGYNTKLHVLVDTAGRLLRVRLNPRPGRRLLRAARLAKLEHATCVSIPTYVGHASFSSASRSDPWPMFARAAHVYGG